MIDLQKIRSASRYIAGLFFGFLLLLRLTASCRADQTIYDDALRNGWANWSWCATDLGASGYVHSGVSSVQVSYTAAWQGFYLSHNNFDTSGFTALRFWIHGGGFGGRTITVAGLVNGQALAPVALSSYASISATDWQQVTIPLMDLHVDHSPSMSGFWLQEASGGPQPPFYVDDVSLVSAPPPAVVHLAVDARRILQQVDRRMFGVNAAVWDGQFGSGATSALLRTMGTQVLRFPGGSLSDSYHWQTNTTDGNTLCVYNR